MSVPVIMDIIVGVVLLAFLAVGARRGLFESLAGLVIILAALVCAGMAASKLTPPASVLIMMNALIRTYASVIAVKDSQACNGSCLFTTVDILRPLAR